jgi:hypothetical protein
MYQGSNAWRQVCVLFVSLASVNVLSSKSTQREVISLSRRSASGEGVSTKNTEIKMSAPPRSTADEQGQGTAQRSESTSAPSLRTIHPPYNTLIILTTLVTLVATAPPRAALPDGRSPPLSGLSVSSTGTGPYGEFNQMNHRYDQPQPHGLRDDTVAVRQSAAPVRPVLCSATTFYYCVPLLHSDIEFHPIVNAIDYHTLSVSSPLVNSLHMPISVTTTAAPACPILRYRYCVPIRRSYTKCDTLKYDTLGGTSPLIHSELIHIDVCLNCTAYSVQSESVHTVSCSTTSVAVLIWMHYNVYVGSTLIVSHAYDISFPSSQFPRIGFGCSPITLFFLQLCCTFVCMSRRRILDGNTTSKSTIVALLRPTIKNKIKQRRVRDDITIVTMLRTIRFRGKQPIRSKLRTHNMSMSIGKMPSVSREMHLFHKWPSRNSYATELKHLYEPIDNG